MRIGILALAASSVLGLASLAGAASLSTGVADWKFKAFTPLPLSVNSGTLYNNTIAAQGTTAPTIAPNSAWTGGTPLINAGASWISALANTPAFPNQAGTNHGLYGLYTYELTLNVAPGTYEIGGKFTSDNLVDSFKVNGVELLTGYVGPTETSFKNTYTVPANTASAPVVLTIRVYNESTAAGVAGPFGNYPTGPNAPTSTTNPTGLILSGEAVLVPLPAAAWAGIALLGVGGVIRRRLAV